MDADNRPQNFFSLDFHRYFLVKVLLSRLSFKKKETEVYQSPFSGHIPMEYTILAVLCVIIGIFGLSHAVCGAPNFPPITLETFHR